MQLPGALLLLLLFITEALCLCSNETKCFNDLPCCGTDGKGKALCCPYPDGVCCSDGQHCCDKESKCHPDKGLCEPLKRLRIPLSRKLQSVVPLLKRNPTDSPKSEEFCPSKTLMCPGRATCCPGPYIGFDCCPMPNAVCCANFQHCCPFNTTCDSVQARCINSRGQSIHWYKKTKASPLHKPRHKKVDMSIRKVHSFGNATCPTNRTISCSKNETCCSIGEKGKQGCCKASKAVCCLGGNFCCPEGTDCDIYLQSCIRKTTRNGTRVEPIQIESISTQTTFQFESAEVSVKKPTPSTNLTLVCPGGKYACPNYMTCCPSNHTGKFGCCPFPNAVCCSDFFHCCPTGSKCDLKQDKCIRGGLFTPLFTKIKSFQVEVPQLIPATPKTVPINDLCPDKSRCPDETTCCALPSKEYGCCPLPDAVCCSDKIHCCPYGTVCDTEHGGCKPGNSVSLIPFKSMLKKTPLLGLGIKKQIEVPQIIPINEKCPDKRQCPDESTCCQLPSKGYGCCPLADAVCCSDKIHCCPHGTVCDVAVGGCKPADAVNLIPFKTVNKQTPLLGIGIKKQIAFICPGGLFECSQKTTCCRMDNKKWGCCPFEKGVCCNNNKNCCPGGYKCDMVNSQCINGNVTINF